MNLFTFKKQRHIPAQAMVEFALALPLLLLLIYGTIEVGRLIFTYTSVANASRQAARYGAAAGEINDVAYYQNCEGIRDIANQSAIITDFDDINITYDRGVTPDGSQIPINEIDPRPEADTCPVQDDTIRNGDRIIVQVSASYEPIISLIPIDPLKIVSSSARTFLISVPIVGSSVPTGFKGETSTPSQTPSPTQIVNTVTPTVSFLTLTAASFPTSDVPPTPFPELGSIPTISFPANTAVSIPTIAPSLVPTPTRIPSITPTAISCTGMTNVTHDPIVISDNIMEMTIINNTGHRLTAAQIYVEWNHDRGHQTGGDKTLRLRKVTLDSQSWSGDLQSPSAYLEAYYPYIPIGRSTIQFNFHQDYEITDGTERIIITISTPGCINYPVDSRN